MPSTKRATHRDVARRAERPVEALRHPRVLPMDVLADHHRVHDRKDLARFIELALACAKYSGRPDENFAKARELYEQLYVTQLDEAYGDCATMVPRGMKVHTCG